MKLTAKQQLKKEQLRKQAGYRPTLEEQQADKQDWAMTIAEDPELADHYGIEVY